MNIISSNTNHIKTRTLFLSKIKNPSKNEIIKKKIKTIFDSPETYLRLSNEGPFKFVVGKQLKGPRYDNNNKLIPYSIVGKLYQLKNKKKNNHENKLPNPLNRRNSSFKHFGSKKSSIINFNDNHINDNELNYIFNNYEKNIKKNRTISNSFLNEIPNNLNDTVKKHLFLQEKNFKNKYEIDTFRKRLKHKIQNKIKNKTKLLLLSTSDNYREKKELNEYLDKSEESNIGNSFQNWSSSLRKPKNFKGIRKGIINYGTDKNPFWAQFKENIPKIIERIKKPNSINMNNSILYKNHFNYIKSDSFDFCNSTINSKFQSFNNQTLNISQLEVKGENLLDFEENNIKLLKGKKKMVKLSYDKDSLKNLNLINNWKYKGFNTLD